MADVFGSAGPPVARLPLGRLILAVGGVYVAQSLVGGLSFVGIPTALRAEGASIAQVGLVSLLMVPWALKFLWAPLAERYRIRARGRRRSRKAVAVGQAVAALGLGVAAVAGPERGAILFVALAFVAVASATMDIAVDAFAVEQFATADRGWGNAAQVGGGYLGIVLGGGAFLMLVPAVGWTFAMAAMAGAFLILALPFLLGPEPNVVQPAGAPHRPSLSYAFARREVRAGLLITVLFEAGVRLVQVLAGPFLVDQGLDLALVGLVNGAGAVGAGLGGTLLGGLVVRRAGAGRAVLIAGAAQALVLAALALAALTHAGGPLLLGLVVSQTFAMALGFVTLYALLMGLSSLKQAGVDFTLFQCADAAVAGLAGYGAALVAARFGYAVAFVLAAAVAIGGLLLLPHLIGRTRAALEARA